MRIRLSPFQGMIPRLDAHLLSPGQAERAKDARLLSGSIEPYQEPRSVTSLSLSGLPVRGFARWRSGDDTEWLRFPDPVSVVRGPVAGDVWERIYWTGDSRFGQPMYSWAGKIAGSEPPQTAFKLGVPAPKHEISTSVQAPPQGEIADLHADERPIRVVTDGDHGLETGDIVRFSVDAVSADEDDDKDDLGDFINASEGFQITVVSDNEFTLDYTDGEVRDYTAFKSGSWEVYIDPGLQGRRFYVHTYVTELGEEGPPSPASRATDAGPTQTVELEIPSVDPEAGENRLIERRRIYRTATGSEGAEFQFVDEVDIHVTSYTDETPTDGLAESLPAAAYDPPPESLHSLDALPSGALVGASDQDVCFSEPYLPHAWPSMYRLTLDQRIVGLAVFDSYAVVATESRPYLITGADPRSMQPTRLPVTQGCVSSRSVVSLGYAVIYASPDGLVSVDSSGAQLATRGIFTPREWEQYAPETMHAYEHDGRYIAFFDNGARRGALVFDPREADTGVTELSVWAKTGFRDPVEPKLYLLDEQDDVLQWDAGEDSQPYLWRSGVLAAPHPDNPSLARVLKRDDKPVTLRLYADGKLRAEREVTSSEVIRLPGGYRATTFQVELEGTGAVREVAIASSMQGLAEA